MRFLYVSPYPTVVLCFLHKSQPSRNPGLTLGYSLEEYHNRDVLFRSASFKTRKKLVLLTIVLKVHYSHVHALYLHIRGGLRGVHINVWTSACITACHYRAKPQWCVHAVGSAVVTVAG